MVRQRRTAPLVAEEDVGLARPGDDDVERAVVVEVRGEQRRRAGLRHVRGRGQGSATSRDVFRSSPQMPHQGAVEAQGDEVEHAVVVDVGRGEGDEGAELVGPAPGRELAGAFVGEDVQLAGGVEEGRVGRAVVVEIGPDECAARRCTLAKISIALNVSSRLLRSTNGGPSRRATMMSRSPSISMSAAQAP